MASTPAGVQAVATSNGTEAVRGYEAPAVLAVFPKAGLVQDLPENLTPHIHTVQNS
jgi:hypothetical protein